MNFLDEKGIPMQKPWYEATIIILLHISMDMAII